MSLEKDLKFGSKRHQFVLDAVMRRYKFSKEKMQTNYDKFKEQDEQFLAYMPEKDQDAVRRNLRSQGGEPQYTTINIPYSYAVAMTAHTYWTSVFFGRTPTFQFEGTSGQPEQSKFAVEALIDHQVRNAKMVPVGYQWLADVSKYGMGIIGTYWDEMQIIVNEMVEVEDTFLGQGLGTTTKKQQRKVMESYKGSKSYNVRPTQFFPDPRVPPIKLQEGEFCGVEAEVGWNHIKKMAANKKFFNIGALSQKRAQKATENSDDWGRGTNRPYRPEEGKWLEIMDMENVSLIEMYVELSPKDWGLGENTFPEKWVFVVANECVVVAARPLGDAGNEFPFDVLISDVDMYSMFTPSVMERTKPMEDVISWLLNTHFYNVRKTLNDQFIVDPSMVVMKDLIDPEPGGIIRLREEYFGSDVRQAVHQLPVQDVTRAHLHDTEMMGQMISKVTGVSDNIMGMLGTGGRKTATEVRSSTTFGVNRLKTSAEWYSATGFSDWAKRMLRYSQQYYDGDEMLRVVGDTARFSGLQHLKVTPQEIQGAFDFVPVDGTLPVDRFAQVSMWANLFGQARNIPQVASTYDMGRIFGWVAQLGGIRNIEQFRIQVQPDDQIQNQAQAGNIVPMRGQGGQTPGGGQTREGGTPITSAIQGVGPAG